MQDNNLPDQASGPPQGLTRQTIVGSLWSLTGVSGQAILQLLVLMVLARYLTPSEYGVVGIAVLVMMFSRTFTELGVGPALVQRKLLTDEHKRSALSLSFSFGAFIAISLWVFADAIADFFRMRELQAILPFYGLIFIFRGLAVVPESLLQRELKFRSLAIIDLSSFLIGYAGVAIPMAMMGFGVWSLVSAHIGQVFIRTIGTLWFGPRLGMPLLSRVASKELLQYGVGLSLGRIASFVADQGDSLIVGKLLGASALGVYGRVYQVVIMPINLIGRVVDLTLFPAMSKVNLNQSVLARHYRRAISVIVLLTVPVTALLVMLAPEITFLVLGDQWGEVILPMQVMAFGLMFRMGYRVSDSLSKATGAMYRRAWRQAVYALFVFVVATVGSRWGIVGVAVSVQIAILLNFLLMANLGCKLTGLGFAELFQSSIPGLRIGIAIATVAAFTTTLCRQWDFPNIATLIVTVASIFVLTVLLVRYGKEKILGTDGYWFLERLVESLPAAFSRTFALLFKVGSSIPVK